MIAALTSLQLALVIFFSLVWLFAAGLFVSGLIAFVKTTGRKPKANRVRPPRAEPMDLSEEWWNYCSNRDRFEEDRELGRTA